MGMAVGAGRKSGRGRRGVPRYGAMADINMTPFIDVMLVLLIIFMVAAPLLTSGVAVDLPQAKAGALNVEQKPIAIAINEQGPGVPDGSAGRRRRRDSTSCATLAKDGPDARVYVRASKTVPYGRVAQIMGEVTSAGYKKVALVTEPIRHETRPDLSEGSDRSGLIVSGAMHAALLGLLVFGFSQAPQFDDATESIPVETITQSQLNEIMEGEKTAKPANAPPRAAAAQLAAVEPTPPTPPEPPPDLRRADDTPTPPEPPQPPESRAAAGPPAAAGKPAPPPPTPPASRRRRSRGGRGARAAGQAEVVEKPPEKPKPERRKSRSPTSRQAARQGEDRAAARTPRRRQAAAKPSIPTRSPS